MFGRKANGGKGLEHEEQDKVKPFTQGLQITNNGEK